MADDRNTSIEALPREIDLLVFQAAGVRLAVDAGQVEGIIGREQAEQRAMSDVSLCAIPGSGEPVTDAAPVKVLLFSDGDGTRGIRIDALDAMTRVAIETIQPLPQLLSGIDGLRPFWGVITRGPEVILLLDLFRLKSRAAHKPALFA